MSKQLTKHFTWDEATVSVKAKQLGIPNTPQPEDIEAIEFTASQMEKVRELLGKPIIVNSWYRNHRVNEAVGGVRNSAHRMGYAVDFISPQHGSVTEICKVIEASGIKYDQLIWEYGQWVHISFAPAMRQQTMHIKQAGKYQFGLP